MKGIILTLFYILIVNCIKTSKKLKQVEVEIDKKLFGQARTRIAGARE